MSGSCLIFDSPEEAGQYCRLKVEALPKLMCDVFDSHGRVHAPFATFVNQRYEDKLDSEAKLRRMIRCALLPITASFPLFW
jgi:hypothetical protein